MNALLIPNMGMYGASIATAISYGLLFVAHYIIVRFVLTEEYHIDLKGFIIGCLFVLLAIVIFYLASDLWLLRWILAVIIGIIEIKK